MRRQDDVARAMTQAVVDALEVIDVHCDDGQRVFLAVCAHQFARKEFLQKPAVIQPGQRIANRLFVQAVADLQIGKRKSRLLRNRRRQIHSGLD